MTTPPAQPPPEWRPLGLAEISHIFGVAEATPTRWKYLHIRTSFPLPDGYTGRNNPYWYLTTLKTWATTAKRNRWPGDDVVALRMTTLTERDAARREADEDRAVEIERRAAALREQTELRAVANRARERLLALQREVEEAEAAATAAEQRAADPLAHAS